MRTSDRHAAGCRLWKKNLLRTSRFWSRPALIWRERSTSLGFVSRKLRRRERESHSASCGHRRQAAEDDAQRVRSVELVVAVRRDQQCGRVLDSPSQQSNDVDGCLVRPVQVFEDEDGRLRAGELLEQDVGDAIRNRPATALAMSTNGPSGRGVKSGSHAPTSTRAPLSCSRRNCWTRAVLPTPASPAMKTTRPRPSIASSNCSCRYAISSSRSRTSLRVEGGRAVVLTTGIVLSRKAQRNCGRR